MAASDKPFRNQYILDIVFGASCGLMLLTTAWMFWQDYSRDFKNVQRTFRDVEATLAERDAVDRLPNPETVGQARADLKAARKLLAKRQDQVAKIQRELTARREQADDKYRGIKADLDANNSYLIIAADDANNYPPGTSARQGFEEEAKTIKEKIARLESDLAKAKSKLDEIDQENKDKVQSVLDEPQKDVTAAEDNMKKVAGAFERFSKVAAQKSWGFGDTFRALPILDAFESPVKIKQIWLPDLTIDYSFKEVPRYDRCTTCHLGIDRPAYTKEALVALGDEQENARLTGKLHEAKRMLDKRSDKDLGFDPEDLPGERKANIGFLSLILLLCVVSAALSLGLLARSTRLAIVTLLAGLGLTVVFSGAMAAMAPKDIVVKTIKLDQKKGEVTQYAAHPRLDLFVDNNSPHGMEKFGCTICHAGQGSATDFTLAAHTANDTTQEENWKKYHGWAHGHDWDYPMLSKRFVESSCVKCHHQMTDLIRYGSQEEAPKLLRGYNLVKENGCFGCHEISGQKSGRDVGPDLRLEPTPALDYLSAAEQDKARSDPANPPGTMRKVGPSLRRLAEKTNEEWVRKWVSSPRGFRPDTKMPHFFGLSTNNEKFLADNSPKNGPNQEIFPATEIHSIAFYLLTESKGFLDGKDFYREMLLKGKQNITALETELQKNGLPDKEVKELYDVSRKFIDVALLSNPMVAKAINAHALRQRQLQERIVEMQKRLVDQRNRAVSDADQKTTQSEIDAATKELQAVGAELEKAAKPVKIAEHLIGEDGATVAFPEKPGDATNGRRLFTERGCLACHAHEGTTKAEKGVPAVTGQANFAPELSRVAAKLVPEVGADSARRWLVQWLLNPNVHHPRTRMPITHLTSAQANDVATWLLTSAHEIEESSRNRIAEIEKEIKALQEKSEKAQNEEPADTKRRETLVAELRSLRRLVEAVTFTGKDPEKPDVANLKALARVYLAKAPGVTRKELDDFLPPDGDAIAGIPAERLAEFARDAEERRLVAGNVTADDLKWYIGKKAIGKQGCYACHDIPGFETAKPIGTALNEWGKKDAERLAFEDADAFARMHYNVVPSRVTRQQVEDRKEALLKKKDSDRTAAEDKELKDIEKQLQVQDEIHALEEQAETKKGLTSEQRERLEKIRPLKFFESHEGKPPVEEVFFEALEHHTREGFLHQKLLAPRSYDYNREKAWDDRLRMPQFKFARSRQKPGETDEQYHARQEKDEAEAREAVMTFILGLTAEPIPLKYIAQPKAERKAEVLGRQVLDKYNCAGCHQIRPGVYEFKGNDQATKLIMESFNNASANFNVDHVFPGHNAWTGAQQSSDRMFAYGFLDPVATAAEGNPPNTDVIRLTDALRFTAEDKVTRDLPAGSYVYLPRGNYHGTTPFGGTFTELMVPYLQSKDRSKYPPDDPGQGKTRGVLPPPLVREGERVQPDWLYKFLLNPPAIRPQEYLILRMPKFNMSPEEARAIVNYFASVSRTTNPGAGITYPYLAIDQREEEHWKRLTGQYFARLKDADVKARAGQLKPTWAARAKKELADAEAALPGLKKSEAEAKEKKLGDLATRTQTVKDTEARIAKLKENIAKGDFSDQQRRWQNEEIYAQDSFKLLTNRDLCLQCHNVGNMPTESPKGPNLILTAERLRPEWVEQWIANPVRLFPYPPEMPQNFANEADRLKWKYQERFVGSPRQQAAAVRDILMDLPRLNDLLANPPPTPPAEGGGKK
jgi:mono/diheme cytochrome c family protein